MEDKCIYNCEVCGQNLEKNQTDSAPPECCGKPMVVKQEKLPVCKAPATAEHSRLDDPGEPCDDGRGVSDDT
ncbi:MAG: hypothetical protein PVI90_11030 [Desulfobacteraceae bacterium]